MKATHNNNQKKYNNMSLNDINEQIKKLGGKKIRVSKKHGAFYTLETVWNARNEAIQSLESLIK